MSSKAAERLIKEIEERKNKIDKSNYKFFDCFLKSLFRKDLYKIDMFINKLGAY